MLCSFYYFFFFGQLAQRLKQPLTLSWCGALVVEELSDGLTTVFLVGTHRPVLALWAKAETPGNKSKNNSPKHIPHTLVHPSAPQTLHSPLDKGEEHPPR